MYNLHRRKWWFPVLRDLLKKLVFFFQIENMVASRQSWARESVARIETERTSKIPEESVTMAIKKKRFAWKQKNLQIFTQTASDMLHSGHLEKKIKKFFLWKKKKTDKCLQKNPLHILILQVLFGEVVSCSVN